MSDAMSEKRVLRLMLRSPSAQDVFFGYLLLSLEWQWSEEVQTAATDGSELLINKEWWDRLFQDNRYRVLRHEALHIALLHVARGRGKDPYVWNLAADIAVHECGFADGALPPGALSARDFWPSDPAMRALTAEQYYRALMHDFGGVAAIAATVARRAQLPYDPMWGGCTLPDSGDRTDDTDDSSGAEEARTSGSPEAGGGAQDAIEGRIKATIASALQRMRAAGYETGQLERTLGQAWEVPLDWRQILAVYASEAIRMRRADTDWLRPDRRFIHAGLYLPGPVSADDLDRVVVLIDTSGSITGNLLAEFSAQVAAIAREWECQIDIVEHDVPVQRVTTYPPGEVPVIRDARGGGGTSHAAAMEWCRQHAPDASVVIALTDGATTSYGTPPPAPVVWVMPAQAPVPPFGRVVPVQDW